MSQRQTCFTACLLLTVLSLLALQAAAVGVGFTPNQKYCYTGNQLSDEGKHEIDIASSFKVVNQSFYLDYQAAATVTYPRSFDADITALVTLGEIDATNIPYISIVVAKDFAGPSYLTLQARSLNATYIAKLVVAYIIYENHQEYQGNLYSAKMVNTLNGLGKNLTSDTSSFDLKRYALPNLMNSTGTIKLVVMISGVDASPKSVAGTFDIIISGIYEASTNTIAVTLGSSSPSITYVADIYFVVLLYNSDFVNSAASPYFHIYSGTTAKRNYTSSAYEMTSFNTFAGLTSFSILSQSRFSFFQTVSSNKLAISSSNAFVSLTFSFVVFYSNYCYYATPYFEEVTQGCYSVCPGSSIADEASLSCTCDASASKPCVQAPSSSLTLNGEATPIGAIVGIAIGAVAATAIIIAVFLYFRNRINNAKSKSEEEIEKNMKEVINLERVSSNVAESGLRLEQDKISNPVSVKKSSFRSKKSVSQSSFSNSKTSSIRSRRSIWLKSKKYHSIEQTCEHCLLNRTYVESNCGHYFHYTCLMKRSCLNKGCPECRKDLRGQVKYFCNRCGFSYRNIGLMEEVDQVHFVKQCDECVNAPF